MQINRPRAKTVHIANSEEHLDDPEIEIQIACANCALDKLCFPNALPVVFRTLFPLADEQRIRLGRGESLFCAGDSVSGIYAVKAGFLKTCMPLPDGQRKIVEFHAVGDPLGLDSLGRGIHTTDAIALNGCEVCVIPLGKFEKLLEHPTESVHVRRLLATALSRIETHAATLGMLSAKQRVATFLLDMSGRWASRKYSKNEFVLFMSRMEIGNYLGLTFETVSRALAYFQAKKWIIVRGRNVLILDMPALQAQLTRPNEELANH